MSRQKVLVSFLFIVLTITTICVQFTTGKCSIDIRKDLPISNVPIFVDKNHKLISPNGSKLELGNGERVGVICSGPNNKLISINRNETILQCENGQIPSQLQCSRNHTATVIEGRKACILGGILKYIGFITHGKDFVKYLEICYNMNKASVIYTHHIIPGKSINYRLEKPSRPFFSPVGGPNRAKLGTVYTQKVQYQTFTRILGDEEASKYFNASSYISRGHLSPDADGVFISWQLATYFYINVAPQWQNINSRNWLTVEKLARRKAARLNDNLEIYTGISGILSLPNSSGKLIPLHLNYKTPTDALVPVPMWYWKILKYQNEAIAFVTMNNPFANNKIYLCSDICAKYNWPTKGFHDFTKGFTYCCSVADLIRSVSEIPAEAFAPNIMEY